MRRCSRSMVGLVSVVVLGAMLRAWNLDGKLLWLDEAITVLFSLGHRYTDLPLGDLHPLADLQPIFEWHPASCAAIAESIRTQSTHPPLFFCWLHQWLGWLIPLDWGLAGKVRSLPALLGTVAIVAVYRLNRVAFSPAAGLSAALLMAVSPFAVYLSQEARHYTLPMLLLTLTLLGLVLILQDLCQHHRIRPEIWLGWISLNGLGFYTHYFLGLTIVAQVLTLLGLGWGYRTEIPRRAWGVMGGAIAGILLIDAPLLPQFLEHLQSPATDWLNVSSNQGLADLSPLLRFLGGLIVMVILLPVEQQPLGVTVISGVLMLGMVGWLGERVAQGLRSRWSIPSWRLSILILGSFLGWMILQDLGVIYGLGKDLTQAFRYNFTLYPAVCALLGASLVPIPQRGGMRAVDFWPSFGPRLTGNPCALSFAALAGLLSCGYLLAGLTFQKPFQPQQILERLQAEPDSALLVVQTYDNWQSVAFGLSLAANMARSSASPASTVMPVYWGWQAAATWSQQSVVQISAPALKVTQPLRLWVFSPFGVQDVFPGQVIVATTGRSMDQIRCQQEADPYQAMNVWYQPYACWVPHPKGLAKS